MRITIQVLVLCMTMVAGSGVAFSQSHRASGTNVALLDFQVILEQHQEFRTTHEVLKQELQDINERSHQQQQALLKQRKGLQRFRPGSADYRNLEKQLTQRAADLQVQRELKLKDLGQREARLFFEEHQRVVQAVEGISRAHGIGLVLRFVRREVDRSNPADIRRGLGQAVVYQRSLDITNLVLAELKRVDVAGRQRKRK